MAYDTELADRIRELLAPLGGVEVGAPPACGGKPVFGGLAFLIGGNMAVVASGQGGLLVRVPPEDTDKLLGRGHVSAMVMAGREVRGWLRVDSVGVKTRRQLHSWVARGADYARTLPPK